jgi:hypothetical protein
LALIVVLLASKFTKEVGIFFLERKEAGNKMEEVKLQVSYVAPPQPPCSRVKFIFQRNLKKVLAAVSVISILFFFISRALFSFYLEHCLPVCVYHGLNVFLKSFAALLIVHIQTVVLLGISVSAPLIFIS